MAAGIGRRVAGALVQAPVGHQIGLHPRQHTLHFPADVFRTARDIPQADVVQDGIGSGAGRPVAASDEVVGARHGAGRVEKARSDVSAVQIYVTESGLLARERQVRPGVQWNLLPGPDT